MKEEISSLELYYLVKEFQDMLNGRIDKIYQRDRSFLITMHVRGKGRRLLKIDSNLIYLTEHKEEFPETPPGYCTFLRKYLGGSFIREIKQKGSERIIEIIFESKEKKYFMIIELFANGNVVLCDEEYKILSALESHKWKDRTVRGGIKYEFPPEQINSFELSEKEFIDIIKQSERNAIVKTLAKNISLGGLYSEEICLLSNIDKIKKPSLAEMKELHKQMKKLLGKKVKANIVGEEIMPFELKLFDKEEKKYFDFFSEAIDSKFSKKIQAEQKTNAEKTKNKEVDKIKVIIKQQEETIKGMGISTEENQKKGEFIYENYEKIKNILADFDKARKKYSWEELKEILKSSKIIKKINEKEGQITIEI